jgi:hypothetical protein
LRAAVVERDARIAELEGEKAALANPVAVASTGDPVQDWINTL